MSLDKIIACSGGGLFVLLILVEISPLKINPWSWLAKAIRKAMVIAAIEKKLDEHINTDDKRDADSHRVKILQFNNELLRSIDHTKEEFIEVLAEIDTYERFCEDHPDYPNNRAVLATAVTFASQKYVDELKKSGKFTKENQECALKIAKSETMRLLTQEAKDFIANAYGSLDQYLEGCIKAEVCNQKMGVGTLTLGAQTHTEAPGFPGSMLRLGGLGAFLT